MKPAFMLSLVLALQSIGESKDGYQANALPGFNYWELSFQIERSKALCDVLEISPSQRAAVKELRRNLGSKEGKLSQIYTRLQVEVPGNNRNEIELIRGRLESNPNLDRAQISRQLAQAQLQNVQKRASEIRSRAILEMDEEVKTSLENILTEGQMKLLLPTAMRAKYNSGLVPFSDPVVISHLDLQEWLGKSQKDIEIAGALYNSEVSRLRRDAGRRLIISLPEGAQQRFIDYVGNELTKILNCRLDDQLLEQIPFPPICRVSELLESPELMKAIGINESQRNFLRDVESDFLSGLSQGPPKGQSPKEFVNGIERVLHKSVVDTLSIGQTLQLQRHYAHRSFLNDLNYPFSQQEFMTYLALDVDQASEIKRLAAFEELNAKRLVRELDDKVFKAMCLKLPATQQERMSKIFSGIWEIAITDPLRWSLAEMSGQTNHPSASPQLGSGR